MQRPGLLLMICVALAACASTPGPTSAIPWSQVRAGIPADRALLYVVRPQRAAGRDNHYRVSINGTVVAEMATGTYFSRLIPPAEVHIAASTVPTVANIGYGLPFLSRSELALNVRAGEIYFVRVGVDIEGGPTLAAVEPQAGESLVSHAKKLEIPQQ